MSPTTDRNSNNISSDRQGRQCGSGADDEWGVNEWNDVPPFQPRAGGEFLRFVVGAIAALVYYLVSALRF